jgi:hypothetical protein
MSPQQKLLQLTLRPDNSVKYFHSEPGFITNITFSSNLMAGSSVRSTFTIAQLPVGEEGRPGLATPDLRKSVCELVEGKVCLLTNSLTPSTYSHSV